MTPRLKKILLLAAVICSSFFWFGVHTNQPTGGEFANAADANQGITVNVTIPVGGGGGGGGGGGPGGSDVPPIIFAVVSSTSFTTATVTWSASDDLGVSSTAFVYGPTISYGTSGVVAGTYKTTLSGLATGTLYYFKISVVDTGSHTALYTGIFSTSPAPPDITPPIISNVQKSVGVTTATIKWDTNESADSQINYGLTNSYGSNYFDPAGTLAHSAPLANLTPNTLYHFKIISTDSAGNSSSTPDATFTTSADTVPPPDASNFVLTTTTKAIVLSWINPSLAGTPDFSLVKVVRKIGAPSVSPGDGNTVYTGAGQNFTDFSVVVNTDYFYTIFSFDTSNNHSPGIFRNGTIYSTLTPPPPPLSPPPLPPPPTTTPPVGGPTPEICGNGLDDDANGKIDCADSACAGYSGCGAGAGTFIPVCNNGADDDGDGKIDYPADPGCESPNDNDEYNSPEATVPTFAKINLSDLGFLAGNRQIKLEPTGNTVTGLSGANLTVSVSEKILASVPKSMVLKVGDTDQHQFVYNSADKMYYAEMSFYGVGTAQAYLEIDYGSGQFDSTAFKLNSLPWGQVVDDDGRALANVQISLWSANNASIDMGAYGQINPIISGANGSYGWMIPNGSYQIVLRKDGHYDRAVARGSIANNVINEKLILIAKPLILALAIDPEASLQKNIANVAKNLTVQAQILSSVAVQKIQDAVANPEVQKVNQQVVAPTAIAVVVVGAASLISWLDFLPLLRLLFLQPLMLLGWRKREKWGLVYNSLNKLPVDLAVVRLISLETNRVVQSKVTDAKGRFIFMVNPGKYKIEAQKNSFIFPSKFLEGYKSDGQKVDIYHGEPVEVINPASITASIPLDPVGAQKKPLRLVLEKFGRRLQTMLSWLGILVTAASLYISPKWYIAALLAVHVLVFFIFRRLAVPAKPKNWGIVYDETTTAPIGRVIARLFSSQFNKLVDTQVTDSSGKYYFMAGDGKYYATYEHKAYHPQKTEIIDLEGKDAEVITIDVKLKKN
ncbi:MAG: hypothetical protein AAB797_03145 [Patescibacteria group bacterium]